MNKLKIKRMKRHKKKRINSYHKPEKELRSRYTKLDSVNHKKITKAIVFMQKTWQNSI